MPESQKNSVLTINAFSTSISPVLHGNNVTLLHNSILRINSLWCFIDTKSELSKLAIVTVPEVQAARSVAVSALDDHCSPS